MFDVVFFKLFVYGFFVYFDVFFWIVSCCFCNGVGNIVVVFEVFIGCVDYCFGWKVGYVFFNDFKFYYDYYQRKQERRGFNVNLGEFF